MPLPAENGISVVIVEEDSTQRIWQYPFSGAKPSSLFDKPDSVGYYTRVDASVDLAIYKDYVLMANGGIIFGAKMKKENNQLLSLEEFIPLQDLSSYGLKNITRMAISPDEKKIAVAVGL